LTARKAGARLGETRQAFIKAIRKGMISAEKDANGEWRIEPAELHWRRIRTNNPLERIIREIRRRTRVVGAFPDGESALTWPRPG
jgi:transposase-like protein